MKKILIAASLAAVLAVMLHAAPLQPRTAFADTKTVGFPYWPTASTPLLSCTGQYCDLGTGKVTQNTCNSLCDLMVTGQRIIYFALTLLAFVFVPVMMIFGAAQMLWSAGSPERVTKGISTITHALIGLGIGLGAFIIVNTFFFALAAVTGNGTNWSWRNWSSITCTPKDVPGSLTATCVKLQQQAQQAQQSGK